LQYSLSFIRKPRFSAELFDCEGCSYPALRIKIRTFRDFVASEGGQLSVVGTSVLCKEHSGIVRESSEIEGRRGGSVLSSINGTEEPFRLFVDSVRDYAIFMLDPSGHVASWNAGAERIMGYKASEIVGKHFSSFYPDEDVRGSKPQRLLDEAVKNGHFEGEGWRVRKDGSKFWASVTITPIRDGSGKLVGFGKVMRDLTERRQNELALRRSEERARLFIEGVQDYAIFMLDPDGVVSSWNAGAERLKGYNTSEIVGQHFSVFYPEEEKRSGKPAWELDVALKNGRFEDEGWRVRKDGSRFWANVIITPIKDSAGDLLGFTKVTRDCTERMVAQMSLQGSQRKLEQSERSLRDLSLHLLRTQDEERRRIGREIHDSLGQYLAALKMKLDLMTSSPATEEQIECANLVDECVKEVRTISYLLYPPMLEEMGLKSAIPWYLEGFSKRSGIKTTFEIPDDFERLSRDAELVLFRVLQECLTNVQRHSGSATAEIKVLCSDNRVVLEVADSGKGLPAGMLEHGSHGSQDWMGSLGVGLRGMSERVRQIGGALDISSSDKGTEVRATVPLQKLQSTA
jgi:PAS domain S-box-containing protein